MGKRQQSIEKENYKTEEQDNERMIEIEKEEKKGERTANDGHGV